MTAGISHTLLVELRRRDVRIDVVGDRLHVSAPRGAVSEQTRDALRAHKAELLTRLRREARLLGLSLDGFSAQDYSIELAVPWLEETIWFVPRVEHIEDLVTDGVHRGRIWTARELKDLSSVPCLAEQDLVALSRLKLTFDGEVLSITPDGPSS